MKRDKFKTTILPVRLIEASQTVALAVWELNFERVFAERRCIVSANRRRAKFGLGLDIGNDILNALVNFLKYDRKVALGAVWIKRRTFASSRRSASTLLGSRGTLGRAPLGLIRVRQMPASLPVEPLNV